MNQSGILMPIRPPATFLCSCSLWPQLLLCLNLCCCCFSSPFLLGHSPSQCRNNCYFLHTPFFYSRWSEGTACAKANGWWNSRKKPFAVYVKIAESSSGKKYVLMLRYDHKNYRWVYGCPETLAENAAQAVIDWSIEFGKPSQVMLEELTHSMIEILPWATCRLCVFHHSKLLCFPWRNDAVDVLSKIVSCVFIAAMLECCLDQQKWLNVLPLTQSAIINFPFSQRSGAWLMTAMASLVPSPPISTFYRLNTADGLKVATTNRARAMNIDSLIGLTKELHSLKKIIPAANPRWRSNKVIQKPLSNYI